MVVIQTPVTPNDFEFRLNASAQKTMHVIMNHDKWKCYILTKSMRLSIMVLTLRIKMSQPLEDDWERNKRGRI